MTAKLTTDERLGRIDARFDGIESQFQTMRTDFNRQFDKLTTIIVKGFDRIDNELAKRANREDLDRLYDLMDKITKKQEIDEDERLVMGHQLDRLDRWVHEVAKKIGYDLTT